jgi:hypothetical protein
MQTQGVHDGQVQTTCTEGWSGEVDDVVRGCTQLAGGGAHGDGLADADLAGMVLLKGVRVKRNG